jgi:hypothetical protein
MSVLRAVAVFCEDIREERSGQDTLIGTMSDNLGLPPPPALLPKLAVYIRGYLDTSSKPEDVSAWVNLPWGERIDLGEASKDLVKSAIDEARSKNNPLAGLIFKAVISPLHVRSLGVVSAFVRTGKQEILCGILNLAVNPAVSTSSPQPLQSQPAVPTL